MIESTYCQSTVYKGTTSFAVILNDVSSKLAALGIKLSHDMYNTIDYACIFYG